MLFFLGNLKGNWIQFDIDFIFFRFKTFFSILLRHFLISGGNAYDKYYYFSSNLRLICFLEVISFARVSPLQSTNN